MTKDTLGTGLGVSAINKYSMCHRIYYVEIAVCMHTICMHLCVNTWMRVHTYMSDVSVVYLILCSREPGHNPWSDVSK